jgi:hypothetical protein
LLLIIRFRRLLEAGINFEADSTSQIPDSVLEDTMMAGAVLQATEKLRERSFEGVAKPRVVRSMDYPDHVSLASLENQSIVYQVKVDAEAPLLPPVAEVEELSHAVAVGEEVGVLETEVRPHYLGCLEDHLKGEFGNGDNELEKLRSFGPIPVDIQLSFGARAAMVCDVRYTMVGGNRQSLSLPKLVCCSNSRPMVREVPMLSA